MMTHCSLKRALVPQNPRPWTKKVTIIVHRGRAPDIVDQVWIGAAPTGPSTNPRKQVASTNKESVKGTKSLKAAVAENIEESTVVLTEKASSRATKLLKAAQNVQERTVTSTEKASSKAKKSLNNADTENVEELTITRRSS